MTDSELRRIRDIFETPEEAEARKRQEARDRQRAEAFEKSLQEIRDKAKASITADIDKLFSK